MFQQHKWVAETNTAFRIAVKLLETRAVVMFAHENKNLLEKSKSLSTLGDFK